MEFNKCSRCGNFFVSNDEVCPKCKTKDTLEYETFKNYVEKNGINTDLNALSNETGISTKNLNRFLNYTDYNGSISESQNIKL
ncbi:MAG: hypothetical protein IJE05_04480 [Clostridia bacterium]|nr:hypothetical protein [Clostridia bacterium]